MILLLLLPCLGSFYHSSGFVGISHATKFPATESCNWVKKQTTAKISPLHLFDLCVFDFLHAVVEIYGF